MIIAKRAYEPYDPADGYRVLVDRLWPRGVPGARGHVDAWRSISRRRPGGESGTRTFPAAGAGSGHDPR